MPNKKKPDNRRKNSSLFSCFTGTAEVEANEGSMLAPEDLNRKLLEIQQRRISLEEQLEKSPEEENLLRLMQTIKRFSEEKDKSSVNVSILNGMIRMYAENETILYVSNSSSTSSTSIEAPHSGKADPKNSLPLNLAEALQMGKKKLVPHKTKKIGNHNGSNSGQAIFIMDEAALTNAHSRLKLVNHQAMPNSSENKLSELEKKLAPRRKWEQEENSAEAVQEQQPIISDEYNMLYEEIVGLLEQSGSFCTSKFEELEFEVNEKYSSGELDEQDFQKLTQLLDTLNEKYSEELEKQDLQLSDMQAIRWLNRRTQKTLSVIPEESRTNSMISTNEDPMLQKWDKIDKIMKDIQEVIVCNGKNLTELSNSNPACEEATLKTTSQVPLQRNTSFFQWTAATPPNKGVTSDVASEPSFAR